MIKYKNEIAQETVENKGNIEGRIVKDIILTPAEMLDKAMMFNVINLPVGSRIKEHSHQPDAEIYYILEGEVEVTDNDRKELLHAGDVVFTGNGGRHSVYNRSNQEAKFMACILR